MNKNAMKILICIRFLAYALCLGTLSLPVLYSAEPCNATTHANLEIHVRNLKKAADDKNKTDPEAMNNLALHYATMEKKESLAIEYYKKAAEANYAPAQYKLGMWLKYGFKGETARSVKLTQADAKAFFQKAATANLPEALYELGLIFEAEGKHTEAGDYYKRVAMDPQAHIPEAQMKYALHADFPKLQANYYKWCWIAAHNHEPDAVEKIEKFEKEHRDGIMGTETKKYYEEGVKQAKEYISKLPSQ